MRTFFAGLILLGCASSQLPSQPAPTAPRTLHRSILFFGQKVGSSVVTFNGDGSVSNTLDIHDNGRGPHADATLRFAPDGTLASLDATGHTELNAPVDEHFSLKSGHARWQSREEHGERDLTAPAFFIPNSATDADAFLLAALQRNGGTLQLLPGGTARLEKAGDATVGGQHLIAYAITGIDFVPRYIWAREDGSYFAEVTPYSWFGDEGAESAAEPLVAKQEELRKARDKALQARLAHKPPPAGFALTHARVLDVERGAWMPGQTVLISGGKIAAVGPALQVPAGAEVIDLAGKALLPGLWDMHAHFGNADGALNIASGVTTARDVGNKSDVLDDFKQRFDEGAAIGPHLYRAGFIEGRGKDAAHAEVTATNEQEARAAVEFWAKRGYEMIKIYNSMDPALVPILAQAAHAHGMTVTGHIPMHMLANEAVRAGYDGVEHINQLMLNFFADHDTETRTPLRFSLVGDKMADFDPQSPKAKEFYALLREHRTVIDPTYVTFEPVYVAEQGKVVPGWEQTVPRLPAQVQRGFLIGGLPLEGKKELYASSWEKLLKMASVLRDQGVTVVAGTDYYAGLALHRELELFVRGGLSPEEALRDATIVPARVMHADGQTGSIAAGKTADLVVIDGDPLANISDIRRTVMTFRSGTAYPAKELYESVGVGPW